MKFYVEVTRTRYARQLVEVEAASAAEAKRIAIQQAPDAEFSTYDCEYEASAIEAARLDQSCSDNTP